jgi:hypothetical protein
MRNASDSERIPRPGDRRIADPLARSDGVDTGMFRLTG